MKHPITTEEKESRLQNLAKRCPTLHALPQALQDGVLGDFLTLLHPAKRVMKVVASYKAALRLQESGFTDTHLLSLYEENPKLSRKEMAKLLQARANATAARKAVFRNLWQVIAGYLQPQDVTNWFAACAFTTPQELQWYQSNKGVIARVCKNLSETPGLEPTCDFSALPMLAKLWRYVQHYPHYPGHTVEALTKAISTFILATARMTAETRAARTAELRAMLGSVGCPLRSDSKFANAYINGTEYCTAEQVTGTLLISSELFTYSHIAWSQLHFSQEALLERLVFMQNKPWIAAAQQIVSSAQFHASARANMSGDRSDEDEDDRFYYKRSRWY